MKPYIKKTIKQNNIYKIIYIKDYKIIIYNI
jgi:hypothetical protein